MSPLYLDAASSPDTRAKDLLSRMTLLEKAAQMRAAWLLLSEDGNHSPRTDLLADLPSAEKIKAMLRHGLGQITRPLGSHVVEPHQGVRALNRLQKMLREETRLGIPAMSHEECLVGLMCRGGTLFPSALAYGATWNPDIVREVGDRIGKEARSIGAHQGLAPVLDVFRDGRWGRSEETFGEDPYLVGIMGTHFVQGLQGENQDFLATLKHFAGHSYSEGARNHAPVHVGERELNDIFLLPFEMAVRLANAKSVMPAYHDIDGEPLHASYHLLTEVLREAWGFDGLIVADYVGVSLLHKDHGVAADPAEAAALAFNAGLDIELPGSECTDHLEAAVQRGLISEDKIDEIVTRILCEKFRLGLFEHPFTDEGKIALGMPETIATAREVARQSVVILKNDGILPLATDTGRSLAVIGPTANDPMALLSGYSFPVHLIISDMTEAAPSVVTPFTGLKTVFGDNAVSYAQGCPILDERKAGSPVFPGDVADSAAVNHVSPVSKRVDLIPEAVALAKNADVAVVCVGDLAGLFQTGTVGEGSDAETLELPGVQRQLVEAVLATGTPTVLVVMAGRPYCLAGLDDKAAAVVMAFAGGQEGGIALAEVLAGRVEPSGRLSISMPKSVGSFPYTYDHKFKSAGTPIAFHFGSPYPFGHGLSYTEFVYSNLTVSQDRVEIDGTIELTFEIRNDGKRRGIAVPQLYVHDRLASLTRPLKELKAFCRLSLESGQAARIRVRLPTDMLSFTGSSGHRQVEAGEFDLMIGASSADIRLRGEVTLVGPKRLLTGTWRMESKTEISLLP